MTTPSRIKIETCGIDELRLSQVLTLASHAPENPARLSEGILKGAGLSPSLKSCPFRDRAELDLGDLDLTVSQRGQARLLLKALLKPEPMHRAPNLVWRQFHLTADAIHETLGRRHPADAREVRLVTITPHVDFVGPRILPGTIRSFRLPKGFMIREMRDEEGQFTGFNVWEKVKKTAGKSRWRLFIRIYRKDLKILIDPSTGWIRDFWSPGLNEAVWRIEIVFQRCHLRKAGIRDLLPASMQRAWEWALSEILRQVRGPQENLTPLWRMLLAVTFVLPWDASNAPVLPAAPQVPDDSRIRSMTTQGVVGLGRRTARAQGVPLLDSREALHQALDVAIDRRPGLLDVFETAMEHECRKLALPRLRRAQRRSDGTWIVWTTSTPADADWGELGLCGMLDDRAPEEAVDDDGDQGTDSSTEETRTS